MKTILCCPEMENLAKKVIDLLRRRDSFVYPYSPQILWNTFPDGNPDTMFIHPEWIKGSDCFFIANLEDQKNYLKQFSVMYALPHYGAKSVTIILPYFPTATMERVDTKGQIATAKTLMRFLNATPATHRGGLARLVSYDIHSLAVQHFHCDGIIVDFQSAIPLFLEKLQKGKYVFAFPDEGSRKRFHTFFPDPCVICTKDENRIVTIKEGKKLVKEAHIVIVDDMVRNGDTLINCHKALTEAGAISISAYVTHGVFPLESWQKFQIGFENFWVTDSCNVGSDLKGVKPFQVISLAELIAKDILTY